MSEMQTQVDPQERGKAHNMSQMQVSLLEQEEGSEMKTKWIWYILTWIALIVYLLGHNIAIGFLLIFLGMSLRKTKKSKVRKKNGTDMVAS